MRSRTSKRIAIGTLAGNPFPDATSDFFMRFARAVSLGLAHEIAIDAPFMHMHKAEVIRLGHQLGVPLELTLSCMNPRGGEGGTVVSAASVGSVAMPSVKRESRISRVIPTGSAADDAKQQRRALSEASLDASNDEPVGADFRLAGDRLQGPDNGAGVPVASHHLLLRLRSGSLSRRHRSPSLVVDAGLPDSVVLVPSWTPGGGPRRLGAGQPAVHLCPALRGVADIEHRHGNMMGIAFSRSLLVKCGRMLYCGTPL